MRISNLAVLAVVPLLFGLAGCGGGSSDPGVASANKGTSTPSPTKSISSQDALVQFAQCMRKNGVNIQDPAPGEPLRITTKGGPSAQNQKAMKTCQHFLQAGAELNNPNDPQAQDQMLKFAECMRKNGVDVPDPQPGKGLQMKVPAGSEAKAKAAQQTCQKFLPGAGDAHSQSGSGGAQ